jgi:hypothetical protein
MSRVYLDACSIIYLVEAESPFHAVVVRRLLQHQTDPTLRSRSLKAGCDRFPLRRSCELFPTL